MKRSFNSCVTVAFHQLGFPLAPSKVLKRGHAFMHRTVAQHLGPPDLLLIVPPSWGSRSRGISPAPKSRPEEEEQSGTVSHCHTSVRTIMLGTDMFLGSKSPSCLRPQACHPVNQAQTLPPKGDLWWLPAGCSQLARCSAGTAHPAECHSDPPSSWWLFLVGQSFPLTWPAPSQQVFFSLTSESGVFTQHFLSEGWPASCELL